MATITKRKQSYSIRVSCGYDVTGKQIIHSMTWKPEPNMTPKQIEKEVKKQAVLFEEKCQRGLYLSGNIRFADFSERWLKEYAQKQLKDTTVEKYKELLPYICQSIGHIPLEKIQPIHIMNFYDNLTEEGIKHTSGYLLKVNLKSILKERSITYQQLSDMAKVSNSTIIKICNNKATSFKTAQEIATALNDTIDNLFSCQTKQTKLAPNTIKMYHIVLSSILSTAVQWQIIPFNPCKRVKPPKLNKTESTYLDEKEALHLLRCLSDEPLQYQTLVTLLLYTGMRRGEALGLKWNDIDFDNKIITIQRQLQYTANRGLFEDVPKTNTSQRVIKVADDVLSFLKKQKNTQALERLRCGDLWHDNEYVFTRWNGTPIYPTTASSWFTCFITRYKLPNITLHSLRHTNASLLIANGINVATVSKRLGHSNTAVTTRTYTHAIKTADEIATDTLQNIFFGAIKNK